MGNSENLEREDQVKTEIVGVTERENDKARD